MKKFVSVALTAAMIASMGVSAMAEVSFGSGANSDVAWPENFSFDGKLTVVSGEDQVTEYSEGDKITLNPGDVVYMPLFHDMDKVEVPTAEGEETDPNKETVPYTGKVDKDWKIHFSAQTKGRVEDASFFTATASESYLQKDALYVKVEMEDNYDSVKTDKISYGVYVSENRTTNKTNQAQVKADFENPYGGYVDFDWSNSVYGPTVFEVAKNEDGEALFDFADEASFNVKMYSEEKVLLNLSRAFDKDIALSYDENAELEFFNFKGTHDEFSRSGILSLYTDNKDSYVYEVVDGELAEIDFDYNSKEKAVEIKTNELGYYVLSDRELDATAVIDKDNDKNSDKDDDKKPSKPGSDKDNPNMGADDFVGAAVALAVVSVAAAGALALKK